MDLVLPGLDPICQVVASAAHCSSVAGGDDHCEAGGFAVQRLEGSPGETARLRMTWLSVELEQP